MLLKHRTLICTTLLLFFGCVTASIIKPDKTYAGQSDMANAVNATFSLTDDSRIAGTMSLSSFPIHTEFAKFDIPMEQISNIIFQKDNKTLSIKLRNNDKLTGVLDLQTLELNTLFGIVSINSEYIKKIELRLSNKWGLSGIGGDGALYTAKSNDTGTLSPAEVYDLQGTPFIHFALNGNPWPDNSWGVKQNSWSFTCKDGASLSGIGGDGRRYTSEWTGKGTLRIKKVYNYGGKPFIHFSLNDKSWPDKGWGIDQNSWSITFK